MAENNEKELNRARTDKIILALEAAGMSKETVSEILTEIIDGKDDKDNSITNQLLNVMSRNIDFLRGFLEYLISKKEDKGRGKIGDASPINIPKIDNDVYTNLNQMYQEMLKISLRQGDFLILKDKDWFEGKQEELENIDKRNQQYSTDANSSKFLRISSILETYYRLATMDAELLINLEEPSPNKQHQKDQFKLMARYKEIMNLIDGFQNSIYSPYEFSQVFSPLYAGNLYYFTQMDLSKDIDRAKVQSSGSERLGQQLGLIDVEKHKILEDDNIGKITSIGLISFYHNDNSFEDLEPYDIVRFERKEKDGTVRVYNLLMQLRTSQELPSIAIEEGEDGKERLRIDYNFPKLTPQLEEFFKGIISDSTILELAQGRNKGVLGTVLKKDDEYILNKPSVLGNPLYSYLNDPNRYTLVLKRRKKFLGLDGKEIITEPGEERPHIEDVLRTTLVGYMENAYMPGKENGRHLKKQGINPYDPQSPDQIPHGSQSPNQIPHNGNMRDDDPEGRE